MYDAPMHARQRLRHPPSSFQLRLHEKQVPATSHFYASFFCYAFFAHCIMHHCSTPMTYAMTLLSNATCPVGPPGALRAAAMVC